MEISHNTISTVKNKAESEYADYSETLFETLRQLRHKIAQEKAVPSYIVFNDVSLKAMASIKPTDNEAFLAISGVGQVKLERYGKQFIDLIVEHGESSAKG